MKRHTIALAVPLGAAILFPTIPSAGLTSGMPQQADGLLCGRVVAVSCEGPSSAVTLSLKSDAGGRIWQVALPSEHRREIALGVESRYEQHVVCVPSNPSPNARGRALLLNPSPNARDPVLRLDPGQLTVKDLAGPSISLPSDVFRTCDPDVEPARPIHTVKPRYTGEAMRAKIEGSVVLFGVVDRNGVVGQVRVVESLEKGLDAEAQKAFEQWRFRPAARNGGPVSLAVSVEMTFVLR